MRYGCSQVSEDGSNGCNNLAAAFPPLPPALCLLPLSIQANPAIDNSLNLLNQPSTNAIDRRLVTAQALWK
jgi:hypothetical protein